MLSNVRNITNFIILIDFSDGDTSSYKINVVKFVIFLALLNKKIYMNNEWIIKNKK